MLKKGKNLTTVPQRKNQTPTLSMKASGSSELMLIIVSYCAKFKKTEATQNGRTSTPIYLLWKGTLTMHPQVLLLGNGLNRTFAAEDWNKLIKGICCNEKIDTSIIDNIAFPLRAVLATGDQLDNQIKNHKDLFYGLKSMDQIRPLLEEILRIPFDHILTTNYSYEIERVANSKVKENGDYCKYLAKNVIKGERVEGKYLLHSYNDISFENNSHKVWHIHGEARKPQSIVLGHYYYGELLSRMISTLSKRGNKQFERQQTGEQLVMESWLDAFVMGDVYVLGFGYDFSEMDLWWLLNRKKREKAQHGKLYFYEPSQENEVKHSLLETYDAEIERLGFNNMKSHEYEKFYCCAIEDIKKKVLAQRCGI